MRYPFKAFTLVELIVVITILWILATVWFVSYTNYLTSSRDSNRISQITNLSDSLLLYSTRRQLPLPTDAVTISASWANNIISYQWYLSTEILETLEYTNGGIDPKDGTFFTYYLMSDRRNFQLMAFMEEKSSLAQNRFLSKPIAINKSFALDYSSRYPKVYGKKLWILVSKDESTLSTPIQNIEWLSQIDILNNTLVLWAHVSDTKKYTWTWSRLVSGAISVLVGDRYDSCKSIIENKSFSQYINATYTITQWNKKIQVYCDMTSDWGGWTMIAHAIWEDTSLMTHDDINNWVPKNSENCSLTQECLSSAWETLDTWSDLMVYTRWYKVTWTECNDKNLSVKWYTQLPYLDKVSSSNWDSLTHGAQGKCNVLSEVSQGLAIPDISTNSNWPIRMWIKTTSNDSTNEYSLLFYGPSYIPQGLWTRRNSWIWKMDNFYNWDMTWQAEAWHGASVNEQVWFIR